MSFDATFFAFVAFVLFLALMFYFKAPDMLLGMLDSRSQAIAKELHEARKLREDAEKLLAEYLAKRASAEADAKAIVDNAKEQAAVVAEETRVQMLAAMARREKQADDRIAQAEGRASEDIRSAAVEAAIAAAEKLLRERMNDAAQGALVNDGVADLKRKFG